MPLTKQADKIVEEKDLDYGILQNAEGTIIVNALQQDIIITRRRYGDGTIEFLSQPRDPKRGGLTLMVPRFNPMTSGPKCRHCGERL